MEVKGANKLSAHIARIIFYTERGLIFFFFSFFVELRVATYTLLKSEQKILMISP